ncbi:hypothetical protein ML462_11285 [Gramella lutea]|uniref:Uncharacterized protein n=1 Tax=Christiangramia lutea TaxID=1607951 RepID=A0A9X2AC53_9FLAO|nr:hypothetical protein [Christiangramia lutea]MCH4823753.1 hypothetical protein [Christiangramia lutea]
MKKILSLLLLIVCISCSDDSSEIVTEENTVENSDLVEDKEEDVGDETAGEETDEEDQEDEQEAEIEVDLPQKWNLFKYICCASTETSGDDLNYRWPIPLIRIKALKGFLLILVIQLLE